ncbi:lactococcin 972 family bacteriocin [Actinomyces qiguomingii]|uniref:lactococcin 972 family bacteriocin n=1 Tax=Actinomyces qiguomingii TaxID=2057800 RepID=UPI000CA01A82
MSSYANRIPALLTALLLAVGLSAAPTAAAAESPIPEDATEHGSVVITDNSPDSALIQPTGIVGSYKRRVAGGIWRYGTTGTIVYSRFYHPKRCHGSSVQTYNGAITVRSTKTGPGKWSNAQVRRSPSTNEAFYWFC